MSMFGRITQVSVRPSGEAVGLVEFDETFDYASEVFHVDWRNGKSERVYRETTRAITDVALAAQGIVYIGGFEAAGALRRLPVPGKVKILQSGDYRSWREMPVDYRAVCRRLVFASTADASWAATDTGMLLRLEQ
jgi:hypothetical protein